MTDDLDPVACLERHYELVACGALEQTTPLDVIEARQVPDGDAIGPGDGRTHQEHYNEGVECIIAARGPDARSGSTGQRQATSWS
ncbi:MAG TPA: hypothetical protein VGL48_07795 [Acidimicrobiales bacterium]|jgi:hypothetical protein